MLREIAAIYIHTVFFVRRARFEWAHSVHPQASKHAWPSRGRRASPVPVLAFSHAPDARRQQTGRYFAAARLHQPAAQPRQRKPWPSRTPRTCRWRVASPPPQTLLAQARPRLPDRAPRHAAPHDPRPKPILHTHTHTHTPRKKKDTSEPSLAFPWPPSSVPAFPPLSRSPAYPMSVASVAALRTAASGSGRCHGAGSPQVGLNGGRPRSLPGP